MSILYRAVREGPGRILPFLAALCPFSPADGTVLGATGSCPRVSLETTGVVAVVPVMLGTERSSGGGTAGARMGAGGARTGAGGARRGAGGARTGAGGVVAVVPVMLNTGATEESSSGGAAGDGMGAGTSSAIVTVELGVPVKVDIDS